jgi:hypothetical protein
MVWSCQVHLPGARPEEPCVAGDKWTKLELSGLQINLSNLVVNTCASRLRIIFEEHYNVPAAIDE